MYEDKKVEVVKAKVEKVKVEKPKPKKEPTKAPEVKVEVKVHTPKTIGGKEIKNVSKDGNYYMVIDVENTTYKLPESEFNAL